ncbi:MAG: hypothetical protein SGI92_22465 [Bryobacteraceae bacterium]|nr:hypothetical protein [Bryobacteraceae bacterium]
MTEEARLKRNADRLKELFPAFAKRLKLVMSDLEKAQLRPRIQDGYRSPADQLVAFNSGHSKLKFGFHNVTASDGTPESLAVDLLDDNKPLSPSTSYLLQLARAARRQGLETGILWGLPAILQQGVNDAIDAQDFQAAVKVGWDPTHIQPTGITVAQAKSGQRPA